MDYIHNLILTHNWGNSLAMSAIGAVLTIFYSWQKNKTNPIDFTDLFIDEKSGKIGGSEFRINVAFLVTSWTLIFLVLKGTLTEWYLTAYLTAFVADRMFSRKATNDNKNATP
jgi:hypothetical protein